MANYTINNLPNTVSTISDSDIVPLWDSANSRTAKVSVANLTAKKQNLLTFDNTPTENSNNPVKSGGIYEAIANVSGSSAIVASSTTLTGASLATNQILRIFFSADIVGADTSTPLTITYNGTSYPVMAHKDSALISVYAHEVSSGTYKYLQAYTTLEVIFDGTQFVVVGNPIVLSSDNYTIYADGKNEVNGYVEGEVFTGKYWIDGKPIYRCTLIATTAHTFTFGDDWYYIFNCTGKTASYMQSLNVDTFILGLCYGVMENRMDTTWNTTYGLGVACSTSYVTRPIGSVYSFEYTKTID